MPFIPRGGDVRGELFPNGTYKHFTNLSPWVEPSGNLDVADVVIGVFSGESLLYTRAMASAATWMSRFPNSHLYAAKPSETVPVVGLGDRYKLRPDYVTMSDVQPLQIVAVRDMYLRHPDAKWYYIVGDDTYVFASKSIVLERASSSVLLLDSLVRMLEDYDASNPLWLVQHPVSDVTMLGGDWC
jgi:hypothetical protein